MTQARALLVSCLVVCGVLEVAMMLVIDVPAAAGLMALVFLACAWVLWRRPSTAATVVGALFLAVDAAGVPFYEKDGVADWVFQVGFGVVCLVGVVAAVTVLRQAQARRAREAALARSF